MGVNKGDHIGCLSLYTQRAVAFFTSVYHIARFGGIVKIDVCYEDPMISDELVKFRMTFLEVVNAASRTATEIRKRASRLLAALARLDFSFQSHK